ncbi:type I-E CRISPR-associated protein Cas5/CasD [Filomicrobium sp.]|uniref:type I-E CRISPR-associated protein Cas5/CasD n=1 Tax=Filomicrobium sp. TaxID=2024831 RepID=UPI00258DB9A1|nr:type I-E CRISPR-associated protein Cas5/CasD [Filomicrobium sp.]MCV0369519.1 type I-E CRISPR-associated protein Cas5/CasD [Filomicrobium sp.]
MQYLLFTLAAPLAAFGSIAVGERRATWDRPSKSQTLGLIAGALGIERSDEEQQKVLAANMGFAVRVDDPGQLASDYHTTQVPPTRRNRRFATRAEELAVPKHELKTILSRREFRIGSFYTICIWLKPSALTSLEQIKEAIKTPVFQPFAGRKAFPLMLPAQPEIIEAEDIEAAFVARDLNEHDQRPAITKLKAVLGIKPRSERPIFADVEAIPPDSRQRLEERRDVPESRSKWRFGLRAEALLRPATTDGE